MHEKGAEMLLFLLIKIFYVWFVVVYAQSAGEYDWSAVEYIRSTNKKEQSTFLLIALSSFHAVR